MIAAVDERDLDVDDREAGQRAGAQNRLEALLDARDVLFRHRTANRIVDELERSARLRRLDYELDFGVLARTARLLLMSVGVLDLLRDLFAEGDLRRADIGVHFISALEDVDFDVEMQFAHALEDGLAALVVGRDAEGRILGR